MSQLSSLPDVCMFNIYGRLYIHDQLHLGQTCHRFRVLQLSAFKQPYKLRLVDFRANTPNFPVGYIQIKTFPREIYDKIIKHFPNVLDLEIRKNCENESIDVNSVTNLLQDLEWSSKLVSLKLADANLKKSPMNSSTITKSINSLPSLKYLSLDWTLPPSQLCNLTILPRLKQFDYSTRAGANEIIKLFQKHSESILQLDLLKSIKICNHWSTDSLEMVFKLDPKLTCRFANFGHLDKKCNNDLLVRFCSTFPSQKSMFLKIPPNEQSLVQRLNSLSPLYKITKYIHLHIGSPISVDPKQIVCPLNTLTHLYISFFINCMNKFRNLKFSLHFPILEKLTILLFDGKSLEIATNCSICDELYVTNEKTHSSLEDIQKHFQKCLIEFIEPMKACENLKEIKTLYPSTILVKPFEQVIF